MRQKIKDDRNQNLETDWIGIIFKKLFLILVITGSIFCQNGYAMPEYFYNLLGNNENLDNIQNNQNWQKATSNNIGFGWHKDPVWLKFSVPICEGETKKLIFSINYAPLNLVEFWQLSENHILSQLQSGTAQNFSSRTIPSRYHSFPIDCVPNSNVYIRVTTKSSMQIPMVLESEQDYLKNTANKETFIWLFLGGMLSLISYNFFISISTKSLSHLYYVLYLCAFTSFLSTQEGVSFKHIWPNYPFLNDYMLAFFLSGSLLFSSVFCYKFLNIPKNIPKLAPPFLIIFILLCMNIISIPFNQTRFVVTILTAFVIPLVFISAFICTFRGIAEARLFTLGWLSLLLSAGIYSSTKLNIVQPNHFTENAIFYGTIAEALLLSFSLANRFNIISKNMALTENSLQRYLPFTVVKEVMSGHHQFESKAKKFDVTILFADLCNFTRATEVLGAERISQILNQFFESMTDCVFSHGGMIDKFIGDQVMVVFGVPREISNSEQAQQALKCAINMQEEIHRLNEKWSFAFNHTFTMRIGIHCGPVLFGAFGGKRRSDFTIIGSPVNIAARVEASAEPDTIYFSEAIADILPENSGVLVGDFNLKGIDVSTKIFRANC